MTHALKAGKQEANAQVYRAELWHAICTCQAFKGGFSRWWASRKIQLQGSPATFPRAVPNLEGCRRIQEDFQANFRAFEAWHCRSRARVLEAKHQGGKEQLFKELRKQSSEAVDTLQFQRIYTVLEVDPDSLQVHIEPAVDDRGASSWTLEGEPCQVAAIEGHLCSIQAASKPVEGQELLQQQILTDSSDIHHEFARHWAAKWQKHAQVDKQFWRRAMDFCAAFLPACTFELPSLDVDGWYHALKRYKPRAARGIDGFAKQDLERMTRSQVADLVAFLTRIESGESQWPEQMLIGLIMSLDKENQKQGVEAFRPICILSIVFRTWSSIRTRQMLLQISRALDQGLYGYLPQRESKEIWLTTQVAIELACLEGVDQLGLSTDLVAAFNTLPRDPVFTAARKLGVPGFLIGCWSRFIDGLKRTFVVRGEVGEFISSSTGFPEGDPMSTLAMTIVDWAWHVYMQHFAPSSIPLSFVDNLSCLATRAADLAQAFTCIQCFAEAWGLEVEDDKTFAWGLHATSRNTLKALQFQVVGQAKALGGLMTYGKRPRFANQEKLLKSLDGFWQGLKRSKAPLAQKLEVIPLKAWAKVLHGSSGCMLSESRLSGLRAKAVSALELNLAGASSALRLALAQDMTCDPGFYQFWHLISDLRRIGLKQPTLPESWAKFSELSQGQPLPGPFSTLLQLCTRTGGSICPPFLQTTKGLRLDLFRAPKRFMKKLMEQEWINMVARQHSHRQTMQELTSLDLELAHLDAGKLSSVERSRVSALQSGCYIVDAQHCKYDSTKTGKCSLCGVLETVEHKIKDCPRYQDCRHGSEGTLAEWSELPKSLTHHLLVPQNPWVSELLQALQDIPKRVPEVVVDGDFSEWHDLFTDGTKLFQGPLSLAAWAVVNATVGQVLEASPLSGGYQTVPRAELEAALYAVRWGLSNRLCTSLWTDSMYVSDGVQAILRGDEPDADSENWDLWESMCMARGSLVGP